MNFFCERHEGCEHVSGGHHHASARYFALASAGAAA